MERSHVLAVVAVLAAGGLGAPGRAATAAGSEPELEQRLERARALAQDGKWAEAAAAYRAALERDAASVPAVTGLAAALEALGDSDAAFGQLERAIQLGLPPGVLKRDPALAGLRRDARFAPLLEKAERAASPCRHGEPYDDFDFWLGDWDVYVQGRKRARNVITKEMNGCLVRERYSNDFGYSGESLNYYDPETRRWKQNWVDVTGGVVRYTGGSDGAGVMIMQGANTSADGRTQLARVTWTALPDGRVRHRIEQSADEGKTWRVFFEGLYARSDRRPPEAAPAP